MTPKLQLILIGSLLVAILCVSIAWPLTLVLKTMEVLGREPVIPAWSGPWLGAALAVGWGVVVWRLKGMDIDGKRASLYLALTIIILGIIAIVSIHYAYRMPGFRETLNGLPLLMKWRITV